MKDLQLNKRGEVMIAVTMATVTSNEREQYGDVAIESCSAPKGREWEIMDKRDYSPTVSVRNLI
jgi:hypothetical protein